MLKLVLPLVLVFSTACDAPGGRDAGHAADDACADPLVVQEACVAAGVACDLGELQAELAACSSDGKLDDSDADSAAADRDRWLDYVGGPLARAAALCVEDDDAACLRHIVGVVAVGARRHGLTVTAEVLDRALACDPDQDFIFVHDMEPDFEPSLVGPRLESIAIAFAVEQWRVENDGRFPSGYNGTIWGPPITAERLDYRLALGDYYLDLIPGARLDDRGELDHIVLHFIIRDEFPPREEAPATLPGFDATWIRWLVDEGEACPVRIHNVWEETAHDPPETDLPEGHASG